MLIGSCLNELIQFYNEITIIINTKKLKYCYVYAKIIVEVVLISEIQAIKNTNAKLDFTYTSFI